VALPLCLLISSCSLLSEEKSWPKGSGTPESSPEVAPPANPGTPVPDDPAQQFGSCKELAMGPWADQDHAPDPIGSLLDGKFPSSELEGDGQAEPDRIRAFKTLDDYRDPSTLEDPGYVYAAMEKAGYERAAEARWGDDHEFKAVTIIQYRDAAGAKDAMTAHLIDLCRRAITYTVRPDQAGLTLLRNKGAVRTMFVMDDIVVSLFTCGCEWPNDADRLEGIAKWADQVKATIAAKAGSSEA
jgi:hypothetical protein